MQAISKQKSLENFVLTLLLHDITKLRNLTKSLQVMQEEHDVLIIGCGISGISSAYHLKTQCPTKSFKVLERRENLGGTWDFFNYPGIRSDSDMYTFGFNWKRW